MSKKFLKIPQGKTPGYFFVFGPNNWTEIESKEVYGQKFPLKVRELLSLVTLYLTLTLPMEQSAPPLNSSNKKKKSVITTIRELKSRAEKLRSELFSAHHWAENYKPHDHPMRVEDRLGLELNLLKEDADIQKPNSEVDGFSLLRFSLGAVIVSCDNILQQINNGSISLYRDGESWDVWVVYLTLIMESHGLNCGTRRETPRKGEETFSPQPFVRLIKYLHHHVLGRHKSHQSAGGLAKAIDRARASIDVSKVKDDEIEGLVYQLLGTNKTVRRRHDDYSDVQFLIDTVLQGKRVGRHPVVPEPLFYDENFPVPDHPPRTQ
jgi:hypothetical protein